MPDLLDLPAGVVERLAMVALDAREWVGERAHEADAAHVDRRKAFVFFKLRLLGHPGLSACAYAARHAVLRPTLLNAATVGDTEWARLLLASAGRRRFSAPLLSAPTHEAGVSAKKLKEWALHRSIVNSHAEVASLLLDAGADPAFSSHFPLAAAVRYASPAVARVLVDALLRTSAGRRARDSLGEALNIALAEAVRQDRRGVAAVLQDGVSRCLEG